MAQNEEEIDELLLETQSLLTGLGKERLYEIYGKLGTIPESKLFEQKPSRDRESYCR